MLYTIYALHLTNARNFCIPFLYLNDCVNYYLLLTHNLIILLETIINDKHREGISIKKDTFNHFACLSNASHRGKKC